MDLLEKLRAKLEQVPEEIRNAVYWLVNNINLANQLTEEPMKPQMLEKYIMEAKTEKDYLLLVLLLYQQDRDKSRER